MRPWLPLRCFGLEPVDKVDDVEEAAACAVADQGAGNGDGQMRLAGSGAADEHGVALVGEEGAAGQVPDQRLVDRRAVEVELLDVLGERQLGDGELVFDGAGLLLGDLGREQIADDPRRLVLALDAGGHDLVIGAAHAVELQRAISSRTSCVPSACPPEAVVAGAVGLRLMVQAQRVRGEDGDGRRAGSRRRARMLMMTAAEQTFWSSASWQAASTAVEPVGQNGGQDRDHLPIAVIGAVQLARTRSIADGRTQSWNGAPLRSAPGLRASTGT